MSGLFGIINPLYNETLQDYLATAQKRMSHRPWYVTETWIANDISVGLGRMGIGILNVIPQPLMSDDRRYMLFMCGEIYNRNSLRTDVERLGFVPANSSDEALMMCLFLAFGDGFPERIDGVFFVNIFDNLSHRLLLANDRFGHYPHYLYRSGKTLIFAPEVKGVLAAAGVPRSLSSTAVAEHFRFQQLLGEKTFHEDILMFPHGSTAWFDMETGNWQIKRYWDWNHIQDRSGISFEDAVEETGRLLDESVKRYSDGQLRPGVFLSGGLDSRTILGLMPRRDPPPVSANFGQPNSRDVYYAERTARAVGSNHFWFDMSRADWVLENVDLHLALTEGFHSWVHMHSINMLPKLRQVMDVNLSGWDGGTVMGDSDLIRPAYNQPADKWSIIEEAFYRFNQAYTWPGITESTEQMLYTPEYAPKVLGRAHESLAAEFDRYWAQFPKHYAGEYFYIDNHCMRFTQHMVTTGRSHLEFRFPFWDYQLLDFVYTLPPHIRANKMLFRHVITRRTPKLSRIPYDKQEFLPTVSQPLRNLHSLSIRARRKLKLIPNRPWLYADYENYLRKELRGWAENILFDSRTAERGIFNMPYVRSLFDRHLSGQEPLLLGKIAPVITFEMMMRSLFD
jgi:asparagine synthase (glutamine-hydrolysing)